MTLAVNAPTADATTVSKGKLQLAGDLSGTAALPTVKNLYRVFNVKDYGATGNGSTDDTTAIQNAFNAATSGGIVFFPQGTYLCDPVYALANTSVLGAGTSVSIIKRKPATTTNPDSIGNINFHGTSGTKFYRFFVRDIAVDGNKANITIGGGGDPYDVEGFSFKFCEQFTVDNCRAQDAYADGFDFDDCADGVITNCVAISCGGSGIHVSENTIRMKVIGNTAQSNGVTLSRSGIDQFTTSSDNIFVGNYTPSNFRGYSIEGSGSSFIGNVSNANTNTPITTGVGRTWTPTFTNLSGGTLNYARYTIGDAYIDFEIKYTLAGAGVASGELTFTIPSPMSTSYTTPAPIGQAVLGDTGTASYTAVVMYDSATTLRVRAINAAGTYTATSSLSPTIPFTWANTDTIFIQGRYRIA